jgi:hypothetical protein
MALPRRSRMPRRKRRMARHAPSRPADTAARQRRRARKPLNKAGKKARAGAAANRTLKAECVRLDIDSCEVGFKGCTRDNLLTFAHAAKRRELLPGELETKAIVACQICHRVLDEEMSHAEMRRFVEGRLAGRQQRYDERRFQAA